MLLQAASKEVLFHKDTAEEVFACGGRAVPDLLVSNSHGTTAKKAKPIINVHIP